ncbi:Gldg family protein [Chiayiivirga flava]|uniref:ABC-type uncharacterized transport system involved in gliding motility auxiliary subunit n=1 Tax=Chiayiivirga flava TaxID=659595 RepID=A0A7W8FYH2_9GAMM|nr:Gldg family protein [Chiayiivirga flava]MBB5207397.1 ABC-type uncharacterized transport system involved in gliding motility auxiliary subunit [Chiayiivirga flava]
MSNTSTRRTVTGTTLLILAVLFVALVVLSGTLLRGARLDLTSKGLYTLTDGTEAILRKLKEPVKLHFYYSDTAARDIPQLRTYATRVQELLEEIAAKSGGKVELTVIDPQPFSEEEDRATGFGLQAVPLGNGGDTLFFGLAGTNSTDGEATIPFFQPDKEAFLEYDIAKLISSLDEAERPVVGLMSGLPIGGSFDPQAGRPIPGWVIDGELRNLFQVKRVETTATTIPPEMQALVVVHPKNLSDDTLYAIDQFVLRGGRLLAFVDPNAEAEQPAQGMDPTQAMFEDKASDLPKLFAAWGVLYDPAKVVLDAQRALELQARADAPPVRHLAVLGLGKDDLNPDDVVSAQLATVNVSTAGYFDLADGATATLEPLAQSSGNASTVASERVRMLPDPESLFSDFTPTGERYALAARLSGKLKTAFPDRSGDGHLAESTDTANVILVADTDMLSDRLWVQVQQFFGQRVLNAFASNGDFAINAVDNLIGSTDLIAVRTRGVSTYAFDTVDDLKKAADARFRDKERELQAQLSETERKLTDLQQNRGDTGNGALLLNPEQQAELQRFQDEKLRIRKELRQVRRQLDEDIQTLGAKLKFINIAGMPIVLTVVALAWVFARARRRKEAVR